MSLLKYEDMNRLILCVGLKLLNLKMSVSFMLVGNCLWESVTLQQLQLSTVFALKCSQVGQVIFHLSMDLYKKSGHQSN